MGHRDDILEQEVCEAIGWRYDMRPIRIVRDMPDRVEVTGTALKPGEWQALASMVGCRLPDGRPIHVVNVPDCL